MTIRDLIADLRLGLRAVFIRPLQRLGQPPGAERFRDNFFPEGLLPTSIEERVELALASRCVGCGLCDAVPGAGIRPSILPTAFSKSLVDLRFDLGPSDPERLARAEKLCPTGVPLARLDAFLRRRARGLPR
jgi:hypothetical protein